MFHRLAPLFLLMPAYAAAYSPAVDKAGPLTVTIEGPAALSTPAAFTVRALLQNSADTAISGALRTTVIDGWRVAPAAAVDFHLDPQAATRIAFTITPAPGSYAAHYPVHVFADFTSGTASYTVHPVLILPTTFTSPAPARAAVPFRAIAIAPNSGFALWRTAVRRAVIQVFGKSPATTATGWEGTDPQTRAVAGFTGTVTRGAPREAITVHPPWYQGQAGTLFIEYPLALPQSPVLKLKFANAVRDDGTDGAVGDGVTFRIRAAAIDAPDGAIGELVWERHTTAKTWQDAEVDLVRFAGRSIRLQLESHPGPRNNTTNDSSYWAEPTLISGQPPAQPAFPPTLGMTSRSLGRIDSEGDSYDVRLYPGTRGLLDSSIVFATGSRQLAFRGLRARVFGDALEDWRAPTVLTAAREEQAPGKYRVRHSFATWAGTYDLVTELWVERNALRARLFLENAPAPEPWRAFYIEDAGPGAWNQTATRLYAGPGNVLENPGAFSLSYDGHRLATAFAGFDFDGISLVQGLDTPPNQLVVDPAARVYSLRGAHDQTLTLIPAHTVWDAVRLWRDVNGLTAAGGVSKLAGRFVFDLWGGNYTPTAQSLTRALRYGLTDAAVVWHNWQRWGYDYRLPDIFPPNPQLGTAAEFNELARVCRSNGVLFAPHDNYIDFYPDAENFTYDDIAFTSAGAPVKAWLNEGRDAQSYRWRADRLRAPLERNIKLIRDAAAPTAYFIDVWSSASPYDYWTREGDFHSRLETRTVWGEAFAWIRDTLGDQAPTISESGHDGLIGYLDGAQTNHLRVDRPPQGEYEWAVWNIRASDAERVPWFDAAHHDKFVLHGAGYESRYAAGLDTALHGIYSDDYIATEVLTGHPAMVSEPFSRDVVRKYWLLHDLMRALALAKIDRVQFDGSDLHRQHVIWENGAEVWVNRGPTDWSVAGRVLPTYGFYARVPLQAGVTEAAIERREGVIVEWSHSPIASYYNARPYVTSRIPLTVNVASVEAMADRRFRLTLNWNATGPIPDGYRIFIHFTDAAGNILFQGDHAGPGPSGQWKGPFTTSVIVRVPDAVAAGTKVEMRLGLYNPAGGARPQFNGLDDGTRRLRLGAVEWTGAGINWTPFDQPADPSLPRFNTEGRPIQWDNLTTAGALRLTNENGITLITPLPGGGRFEIRLKLPSAPETVTARNESGAVVSTAPARLDNGEVVLTRDPTIFTYQLK